MPVSGQARLPDSSGVSVVGTGWAVDLPSSFVTAEALFKFFDFLTFVLLVVSRKSQVANRQDSVPTPAHISPADHQVGLLCNSELHNIGNTIGRTMKQGSALA